MINLWCLRYINQFVDGLWPGENFIQTSRYHATIIATTNTVAAATVTATQHTFVLLLQQKI